MKYHIYCFNNVKLLILVLFIFIFFNSNAQFYVGLGSGYAFATNKNKITFNDNNSDFSKIGNIFSGVFYKGLIGYNLKKKLSIVLNVEFNPKSSNILNYPKSIIVDRETSFYDGSYLAFIPNLSYKFIKKGNFSTSIGFGTGFNILNYYYFKIYNYKNKRIDSSQVVYSYKEKNELLYKFVEVQLRINFNLKFNYIVNKNFDIFIEANVNSKLGLFYYDHSKIIYEYTRTETFDVNNNPNITIYENEINNDNLGRIGNSYFNKMWVSKTYHLI